MSHRLLAILLLIPVSALSQNKQLTITGTVSCEKSDVASVRIIIVEILDGVEDTVQIKNLAPGKYFNSGKFSVDLSLNKEYKLIFAGDTTWQESRYFEVSTKLNTAVNSKNYSLKDLYVTIWLMYRIRKEGEIYFDGKRDRFEVTRNK